jgi:hypothetical protein
LSEERRPVSPLMIIIALGVIAAMLFPFYQLLVNTERSRRIAGDAFGFVVVTMGVLAVYSVLRPRRKPDRGGDETK